MLEKKLVWAGVAIGALGGYLYYYGVGCQGSCGITSHPWSSTLYGALMGGITFNAFQKTDTKNK